MAHNSRGRSQWPRGLRRRFAAARLLRLWVLIPPGAWMFFCCECCVLGRGLCDGLITRPEEFYRLWCVVECDLETSWMRRPWPSGAVAPNKKIYSRGCLVCNLLQVTFLAHRSLRCFLDFCKICSSLFWNSVPNTTSLPVNHTLLIGVNLIFAHILYNFYQTWINFSVQYFQAMPLSF